MADQLPKRLASVFRLLRGGRHISRDDGADYWDLDRNEDEYSAVFQALGYKLVHHGQGFYYFEGKNYLSTQRLQAVTLFTLILFQDLEENKFREPERAWERTLLDRYFRVDELPHFKTSQRRTMLLAVKVTPETLYDIVLKPMSRFGMLDMIDAGQFQFRSPIYRFVDLCLTLGKEELAQNPNAAADDATEPSPDESIRTPAHNGQASE